MKSRDEAHAILDQWIDNDCVGNLVIFHPPHSEGVDCIVEKTIKYREMRPEQRAIFSEFIRVFDCARGEFWRDKDGNPDRVKIYRSG